jgi:hypothetical protein
MLPVLDERSKIGRVVATEAGPTHSIVDIRLDSGKRVRPGALLYAPISEEQSETQVIVLRVSNVKEHNPYEDPLSSQVRDQFGIRSSTKTEDLIRRYFVATTQPIELLTLHDEEVLSEDPYLLANAGTPVYPDIPGVAGKILGFPNPADPGALVIGKIVGGEDEVVLDANRVLPRHILVAGSTGTGKSYLLGKIAEELHRTGIRHVNIDVHGETCSAAEKMGGLNLIPGENLKIRLSSLAEPEVMEMLPLNHDLHVDIVTRAFINLKRSGRPFGVDEFRRESERVAVPYGVKQNTIDIVTARIDTLKQIQVLGEGFDWREALAKSGAFANIDCRELSHFELRILVGAVARELIGLRKKGEINPLVLSMDEAHLFLPGGHEVTTSSQVVSELIRFGRHHGVGLILSSQSPADIDKRIAKITNTRFFFAIEPSELSSVSGLMGDAPPDLIANLPRFKVGSCLLVGSRDTVKHAIAVEVGQRNTPHGGETPKMTDN